MAYQLIYNNKFMVGFNPSNPPMTEVGTLAGKSIKIMNMTQYGLSVYAAGMLLDYIPAYQFLIMDNRSDLYVQLDGVNTVPYVYPNANVAVKTIDEKLGYQIGILIQTQQPGDVQNISGNVNMTGTVNANIQNTPAVTVSGTPAVTIANAAVPISGSVAISSGSINATIQNASLNSTITNALLQMGCTAYSTANYTVTNLAKNAFVETIITIPASLYDEVHLVVYSSGGLLGDYRLALDQMRFQDGSRSATWWTPPSNTFATDTGGIGNDNAPFCTTYTPVKLAKQVLANQIVIGIHNDYGTGTIASDTLTFYIGLKYSSNTVTNPSNNPVPTTGNYYGTGADGVLNVTAAGTTYINNPANAAAIYNYSSITINSGSALAFSNNAKYVLLYCTGDVTINGTLYAPPGMTNLGAPAQPLTLNGKSVPNCGNGGNGGAGGWSGGSGGTGGTGNCYVAGCGGGGGGGFNGSAGASYGTGYGAAGGGSGASYNGVNGNAGTYAVTYNSATLCIVAGGTITINGIISAPGVTGGNGGAGVYNSPNNVSLGGGGGACGSDAGGGGSYQTGISNTGGGGGAGGSGGAAVFLFSGGPTLISGTINTNGGGGGTGGSGNGGNGTNGQAGQAGGISIYQMGGTAGGL